MDHNQTITDLFLQTHLRSEPRIIAAELYEALSGQFNPKMELGDFRLALKEWFNGPLGAYESVKGRFGGIRLKSEENRIANPDKPFSKSSDDSPIGLEDHSDETEEDSLTVYITPSIRLYQPDSRQWAIQKKNGEAWISQYYQPSLDSIIGSFIRHSMNGEFKASAGKITELKELVKLVQSVKSNLEQSFKAAIVEKTGDKGHENAA